MTFGEKLRAARRQAGLTQDELASRVGLQRRAILQYENGHNYPRSRETYEKLASALGISQPNATYKVNNLVSKGYVIKSASEDDKRECRLQVSDRFFKYYGESTRFIDRAVETLRDEFSPEELDTFEKMLWSLNRAVK